MRILQVDEDDRLLFYEALNAMFVVANDQECIRYLTVAGDLPDVIFHDISMPSWMAGRCCRDYQWNSRNTGWLKQIQN